ncbi:glycine--tRNA ligase subunit beta [Profundibacter sp.]|uniref:glycine--tRNA ligase subunit beta n=1 Tax=Profundibacter sp. TaxID=3101071 RepID=UPI003D13A973
MPDLLIELFSEEIPARMQARAAADLKRLVTDGLVDAGLTYASAGAFSTPRRLALSVEGVLSESPTIREERKGPRVDAPDKAIEGFLRGAGVSRDDLEVRDDKKGQVYFAIIEKPGRPAADIIAQVLETTIRNFPWPKSMRWGAGTLRWVRPLHSILCILSDETGATVVPLDIDGIKSGDSTEGHRFMAPARFSVTSFDDYSAKLAKAHVVLSAQERADHIWNDATNQAFAQGLEVVEDKGLLSEVAGLVEWPVVLMGDIAEDFMGLPPEVLQTSMREHQKFFSVRNPKTDRIEKFVTVANRETTDHGKTILAGNQKVLFARLSDAKFFWENDLRTPLADMVAKLENVTFHSKLGTQAERVARIAALAAEIAPMVGADPALAKQAAEVCKADLSSEMVYEFPELQGLMGRYYAQAAGLPQEVANACQAHYAPLGPSDDVPTEPVSVAVALADKIDTLTGFWAIDEKPTGSKDPFALRRAALGVIRLVQENGVRLNLHPIFSPRIGAHLGKRSGAERGKQASSAIKALHALGLDDEANSITEFVSVPEHDSVELNTRIALYLAKTLLTFFHDRLKVYLKDKGVTHDVIDACLAMPNNDDLTLLVKRAEALQAFLKTDDGENLLQGYKRASNILSAEEKKDGVEYSFGADIKFAETDEERALFKALDAAEAAITPALKKEDFATAMSEMAKLRAPIDAFFEAVQVNTDNATLRRNRLNLLSQIRKTCTSVADLTKVEG